MCEELVTGDCLDSTCVKPGSNPVAFERRTFLQGKQRERKSYIAHSVPFSPLRKQSAGTDGAPEAGVIDIIRSAVIDAHLAIESLPVSALHSCVNVAQPTLNEIVERTRS